DGRPDRDVVPRLRRAARGRGARPAAGRRIAPLPLSRPGGAVVGRHRLHLKRDESLPVGGAHRPLARRQGARSDDSDREARGARAGLVGRPTLAGVGSAYARAEHGDPRAARPHRPVLAAPMSVTSLVAVGDEVESTGDPDARYPIYSITKTVVAAA